MNTIETQKNASDMLSEKQQNPKHYEHHCQEHGAVEGAQAQKEPSSNADCNLGAVETTGRFYPHSLEHKDFTVLLRVSNCLAQCKAQLPNSHSVCRVSHSSLDEIRFLKRKKKGVLFCLKNKG